MAELEIPHAAVVAMLDGANTVYFEADVRLDVVRAIAAPVVATELRRLAHKIESELAELPASVPADRDFDGGVLDVVRELRYRADEIEKGS